PIQLCGRTLRRLDLLAAAEYRDHAAEAAAVRTADRRLIHTAAIAQECRAEVVVHGNAVERQRRQLVRTDPASLGVDAMLVAVAIHESSNGIGRSCAVEHLEQLEERMLA